MLGNLFDSLKNMFGVTDKKQNISKNTSQNQEIKNKKNNIIKNTTPLVNIEKKKIIFYSMNIIYLFQLATKLKIKNLFYTSEINIAYKEKFEKKTNKILNLLGDLPDKYIIITSNLDFIIPDSVQIFDSSFNIECEHKLIFHNGNNLPNNCNVVLHTFSKSVCDNGKVIDKITHKEKYPLDETEFMSHIQNKNFKLSHFLFIFKKFPEVINNPLLKTILGNINIGDKLSKIQEKLKKQTVILNAFSKKELEDVNLLNDSRIKRIEKHAGTGVQEIIMLFNKIANNNQIYDILSNPSKIQDILSSLMRK